VNQVLEQFSIDELLAAIAAKGNANMHAHQAHEQQSIRDQAAREKMEAERRRMTRRGQDPVKWAEEMAHGGLPIASAKVFAEVLSVIYERLEALESAQKV
jgi:hypothetical protein